LPPVFDDLMPFFHLSTMNGLSSSDNWIEQEKSRPKAASLFRCRYLQQSPPSQQLGFPQQGSKVAAEAGNDSMMTARDIDDRI
jgi:hypothetical protein